MNKARGLDAVSQFNAAQRLRKGEAVLGAYGEQAAAGDRSAQRSANIGGGLGAAAGGLGSMLTRRKDEDLLNPNANYLTSGD